LHKTSSYRAQACCCRAQLHRVTTLLDQRGSAAKGSEGEAERHPAGRGTGRNFSRLGLTDLHLAMAMRFTAVLNREGGTLRTIDVDAFAERMCAMLERHRHRVDVEIVGGARLEAALARAAASRADIVIAGGGDGTVSTAAAALMRKKKALAVLPAGTMNFFARGLGIPLSLDAAIEAFAEGRVRAVDMASANRRPFVHQYSIGMHAKMVDLRDNMDFTSRLGKVRASVRAALTTMLDPPTLKVALVTGDAEMLTRATALSVTNNLFGEGHLPYADHPDGGVLGIYLTVARHKRHLLRMLWCMARGRWRDNPHIEVHESDGAVLRILSRKAARKCVIDGELQPAERETIFEVHKKVLNVLVPRDPVAAK
jgi:diacylglycerol kinase family enzyme